MSGAKPVIFKGPVIKIKNQANVIKLNKLGQIIPGDIILTNLGLVKRELIYESSYIDDEIIRGKYKKICIENHYNKLTTSNRTIANAVTIKDIQVEITSDAVTKVIGQKNYDSVFNGLHSIMDQQRRTRAILSLLTPHNKLYKDNVTQTDQLLTKFQILTETGSQTDMMTPIRLYKNKKAMRTKRKLEPYVVREDEFIKPPQDLLFPANKPCKNEKYRRIAKDIRRNVTREENELPVLDSVSTFLTDDSDTSISDSDFSILTEKLEGAESFMNLTDKLTEKPNYTNGKFELRLFDGTVVNLPAKPEDLLHIATRDNLAVLDAKDRKKVLVYQGYIDWKLCLVPNEDDNLPIHLAVLHNDVDLLARQCMSLQSRNQHVDIVTDGNNLSALHMAILRESNIACISTLLQHKADPLEMFEDERNAFHRAAESTNSIYMQTLLDHVRKYPREIMEKHELWPNDLNKWTDEQMIDSLYVYISEIADGEGYTSLMLACKLGRNKIVELLLKICNSTVNTAMKTSGDTALYLAVEGAGLEAIERGNKSVIAQRYLQTIECLLVNCADPALENFSGSNVTTLLAEFNINPLSMFMADQMSSLRQIPESDSLDNLMIIRNVTKVPVVVKNRKKGGETAASGNTNINILSDYTIVDGKTKRKNKRDDGPVKKSKTKVS